MQKKTKPNGEALSLSAELIRIFVLEAINRAGKLAGDEESPVIEASHLQQILPQLLLDFS